MHMNGFSKWNTVDKGRPHVNGAIDGMTRCRHYHGPTDVIAIKFKCCGTYYSCYYCHEEEAGHPPDRWGPNERNEKALLCGGCGTELTIETYLGCGYRCPVCGIAFNPRCEAHYPLYFQ
jgi:uncharacterized CHY-type Zn-finger protein